jgi:hypothetical protein
MVRAEEEQHLAESLDPSMSTMDTSQALQARSDSTSLEGNADDIMYCIKWIGLSHMHNTWHTEDELNEMNIKGIRKLKNYMDRIREYEAWKKVSSIEEVEYAEANAVMARELAVTYTFVERVVSSRDTADGVEYFCKWENLGYSCATWENEGAISGKFQAKIDDFLKRNSSTTVPFAKGASTTLTSSSTYFRPYTKQPDFLPANLELRDYQLAGLNWLAHSWHKRNSVILADEMGLGMIRVHFVLYTLSFSLQCCPRSIFFVTFSFDLVFQRRQDYPDDFIPVVLDARTQDLRAFPACCASFDAHGLAARVCQVGSVHGRRHVHGRCRQPRNHSRHGVLCVSQRQQGQVQHAHHDI